MVKTIKSKEIKNPKKIGTELKGEYNDDFSPDLIVANKDVCYLPKIDDIYYSPFYIENKSSLSHCVARENAFALGICSLLYALDTDIAPKKWTQSYAHFLYSFSSYSAGLWYPSVA